MKKTTGILIFVLALVAFLNAGPTFAAQAPALNAPAPAPAGCAGTLNIDAVSAKGQVCQVPVKSKIPEPEFMAPPQRLKYCTCSCGGAPCTSDADCGGAVGSCRVGITCC